MVGKETPKYEYRLMTWGGFFNDQYKRIHGEEPGVQWFDTEKERKNYLDKLRSIEKELNARHLAVSIAEGYNTRAKSTLHRVVEYEGTIIYSEHDISFHDIDFEGLNYHLDYKWTPGFNDDQVELELQGKEVDYDKVVVLQEWISGSFTVYKKENNGST